MATIDKSTRYEYHAEPHIKACQTGFHVVTNSKPITDTEEAPAENGFLLIILIALLWLAILVLLVAGIKIF